MSCKKLKICSLDDISSEVFRTGFLVEELNFEGTIPRCPPFLSSSVGEETGKRVEGKLSILFRFSMDEILLPLFCGTSHSATERQGGG